MCIDNMQNTANTEKHRTQDNRPSSSFAFCDGLENTGLENGDAIGVDICCLSLGIAKIGLESLQSEDTTDITGVVCEEERANAAESCKVNRSEVA